MSETRGRHWCFTTFDLTLLDRLPSLAESGTLRYVCAQVEQCPTTGKEHVQGYLEAPQKRSIASLKKALNDVTAHFEIRRGSRDSARDYCRKEESRLWGPYEFGEWIGGQGRRLHRSALVLTFAHVYTGARTDLQAIQEACKKGRSTKYIADQHFATWVKYHRAIEKYQCLVAGHRDWPMEVYAFIGPPGSGKVSCGETLLLLLAVTLLSSGVLFALSHAGLS